MAKTMVVDPPGEGLEPACPACCDGYIGRHNTICQECGGPIYDKIIGLGELLFEYGHIPQVGMKDHDNLLKQVDQLRTDGESWFTISRKLGCDIDAIRVYWGWHLAEMGQMCICPGCSGSGEGSVPDLTVTSATVGTVAGLVTRAC